MKNIHLWGVNQNNLKNVEVEIPLGSFTVICGPSGSGKSSLAFQTLFAEGQRRYIDSLSNYAKQFLNKAPKPDVEGVENIPPAISIEQKNTVKTSRSTVGTTTEILDYLRLLFEKISIPHCPEHGIAIEKDSVSQASEKILESFAGDRGYLLTPIFPEQRAIDGKKLHAALLKDGFLRIYLPPKEPRSKKKKATKKTKKKTSISSSDKKASEKMGQIIDLSSPEVVKKGLPKDLFFVVIDRMIFNENDDGRVADSLSQAYRTCLKYNTGLSGGHALVINTDGKTLKLSEEFSCSICSYTFPAISSRLFSFNSPIGACPECKGFGNLLELDPEKVIPNDSLSLVEGALHPFTMPSASSDRTELFDYCKKAKINTETPWKDLPPKKKEALWEGNDKFYGVKGLFEYFEKKKYKMHVRVFLARYKSPFLCHHCQGSRLNPVIKHITISKKSINDLTEMTIEDLLRFMMRLKLTPAQKEICEEILKQVISRLKFLIDVGAEYLTLNRETRTLSGGEYQRLHLANQLGMELSQTLYVLDEPTVGLHPRDNDRLIQLLKKLNDLGNTLVIVEHDKDVISNSNNIIEMGPGSGHLGGEVIYSGNTESFYSFENSNTNFYIKPKKWTPPRLTRPIDMKQCRFKLSLSGCTGNNLKKVTVNIPLNRFITVTGVSGSGKSSLITQTLYPALAKELGIEFKKGLPFSRLNGAEALKNVLFINQAPIGKSSRSNPVTYLKIYDAVRSIMASTDEAKRRGYTPGTFSMNVEGGRCPTCSGTGVESIEMPFMDDIELVCDDCDGKKFRSEVLEIEYKKKNINDILNLTVSEAMDFFVAYPNIRRPLSFLKEVGLDYIRLGQSARSLSGGESQRLKVAREFNGSQHKNTLYILDEPTTGLHFREIQWMLKVLNKLIEVGGSVIVIEHNLDVIAASDYVIDIGPEAGEKGGKVVFEGSPVELTELKDNHTGIYLKEHLDGNLSPKMSTKKKSKRQRRGQTSP